MDHFLLDSHDTFILTVANSIVKLACIAVLTGCVFLFSTHRRFFVNWIFGQASLILAFNAEHYWKDNDLYGMLPETGSFVLMGFALALASNGVRLFFSEERRTSSLLILVSLPAAAFLTAGVLTQDQDVMSAFGFFGGALVMLDPAFNFYRTGFRKNGFYGSLLISAVYFLYSLILAGGGFALFNKVISVTAPEGVASFILLDLAGTVFIFTSLIIIVMEQAQRDLRTSALQDPLTGLANRRRVYQLTERLPISSNVHVLLIDIDHFKMINDVHGHGVGDAILVLFSDRIKKLELRSGDVAARWGGEEFLLVLRDYTPNDAKQIAETCLRELAGSPYDVDDQIMNVTASIGMAARLSSDEDLNQIIGHADKALYVAKAAGRNRVEIFDAASSPPDEFTDRLVSGLKDAALSHSAFSGRAGNVASLPGGSTN